MDVCIEFEIVICFGVENYCHALVTLRVWLLRWISFQNMTKLYTYGHLQKRTNGCPCIVQCANDFDENDEHSSILWKALESKSVQVVIR
jgi:hypothetical protein